MRQAEPESTPEIRFVTREALRNIVGMPRTLPLTPRTMAQKLEVTFFPHVKASPRVQEFARRLEDVLVQVGVTVHAYDRVLIEGGRQRLRDRLVVIAAGEMATGNLAVDHVSDLRTTPVMGIIDGPCPAHSAVGLQEKLNSVVTTLAWSILNVVIYVDDDAWTVCTMNGAIVELREDGRFEEHVRTVLIPKLAAPVVPPHAADFDLREGSLRIAENGLAGFAQDFARSGPLWAQTGLMLFHTSLESLSFRNRYYQRIAAAFLDHRTGMSYGFLARQLPVPIVPALTGEEAEKFLEVAQGSGAGFWRHGSRRYVEVRLGTHRYIAEVPDVWVLTTRSGCDKSHVDVYRDVVMLGLVDGRVVFETPDGVDTRIDCKPSYDTLTILAHAAANAVVAGILLRVRPKEEFPRMLARNGAALAHWHGMVDPSALPPGFIVHGESNPPVSCSTYQSASYAFTGKLSALERSLSTNIPFAGDVHVEPFHGVNITGAVAGDSGRDGPGHHRPRGSDSIQHPARRSCDGGTSVGLLSTEEEFAGTVPGQTGRHVC